MDNVCPSDLAVLADRQRLTQVLVNLLTNACDASAPGGAVLVDATREPDAVLLRVIDAGRGVPAELKERVFEPFFTTKPPDEGTGLGLSVVYGIVEEHGGRVWIESEPGCGTTVLVRLPIAPEPGETAGVPPLEAVRP
jgi:signal transduction histidine kinase